MVKFCVFYYGKPEDPALFDEYYWNHHLPLVAVWPRIRRIVISKAPPEDDLYQITELFFDSRGELEAALRSPERAVAGEDGRKLPGYHGRIERLIFEVTDFPIA